MSSEHEIESGVRVRPAVSAAEIEHALLNMLPRTCLCVDAEQIEMWGHERCCPYWVDWRPAHEARKAARIAAQTQGRTYCKCGGTCADCKPPEPARDTIPCPPPEPDAADAVWADPQPTGYSLSPGGYLGQLQTVSDRIGNAR